MRLGLQSPAWTRKLLGACVLRGRGCHRSSNPQTLTGTRRPARCCPLACTASAAAPAERRSIVNTPHTRLPMSSSRRRGPAEARSLPGHLQPGGSAPAPSQAGPLQLEARGRAEPRRGKQCAATCRSPHLYPKAPTLEICSKEAIRRGGTRFYCRIYDSNGHHGSTQAWESGGTYSPVKGHVWRTPVGRKNGAIAHLTPTAHGPCVPWWAGRCPDMSQQLSWQWRGVAWFYSLGSF